MSGSRLIPAVSCISLGIGCYLGAKLERYHSTKTNITSKTKPSKDKESFQSDGAGGVDYRYYFPLPVVSAASSIIPLSGNLAVTNVPNVKPSGNRVSEIMRHGFPSQDNLRTYEDFVLAYDKRNRTAHWVFEHLTPDKLKKTDAVDRNKSVFSEDQSVHHYFRATNADYKGSGYDRGHLAAARNHAWGQIAMDQTFTLSNMAPQVGKGFNRDAWNTLEKFVRHLTKKYPNVYVCTGPLYLPRREPDGKMYVKYEVIGQNNVAVPTHFFKVVVMETANGEKELLSFVMPNQALPDKIDLKSYLVPTDIIERSSGLLLFDKIPRKAFTKINGKNT